MQSQPAVLMFADLVGYSALMERDAQAALGAIRALRSTYFEPVVVRHGGTVLKRLGDGWIVTFDTAAACLGCAMAIQNALRAQQEIRLRIGAHIGDMVQDGDDHYGPGLNIAQRIEAESPPGGLMVSQSFLGQLSADAAAPLSDAGIFRLKNIAQPVRLYLWRPDGAVAGRSGSATSIAVAPTEHAPLDPETEALAADLHDQLVTRMSRRVGVDIYDGAATRVEQATYDLRSRLRVASGMGRLSLTLILRSEGRPVWSETYDRSTKDIFDFCDNVLERAEADLRVQTNAFDGDRLAHIPDNELSVSELRARAANCYYRVTYAEWQNGLALMNRALDMNPLDGVALAMRAEAHLTLHAARYRNLPAQLVRHLANDLDMAVENAPGSDYVFWVRGQFRLSGQRDIDAAKSDLRRSRELNPAYLENHELEGHIHMAEEQFDRAAACFDRVLDRQTQDPLMPYRAFLRAVALYCAGQYDEATTTARRAADIRPTERAMHLMCALACQATGREDQARRSLDRANALPSEPAVCSMRPVLPSSQKRLADRLAQTQSCPPGGLRLS